jgi:hypothetical protein
MPVIRTDVLAHAFFVARGLPRNPDSFFAVLKTACPIEVAVRVLSGVALVIVITGCGSIAVRSTPTPLPTPPSANPIPLPSDDLQVRVTYRYQLYTHCGLRPIELAGSTWTILGVLSDGSGNPPPGFSNPFDTGTLWLTDRDHAIFRSSQGAERQLIRGGSPPTERCL